MLEKLNRVDSMQTFNFVGTKNFNKLAYAENEIINILNWNEELDIPVLLFIRPGIIKKLAIQLAGYNSRSFVIGLAGETACGKTTITSDIFDETMNFAQEFDIKDLIVRVKTDDYYYDRSERVKAAGSFDKFVENYDLDVPEAFELNLLSEHLQKLACGQTVWLPKYDMSGTAKRYDNHTRTQPARIIITEGIFTLNDIVKNAFDLKIYVDVSKDVQKARWYQRASERNLGESADRVYNNASEKAQMHIRPTKDFADIVFSGEASRRDIKTFIRKIIHLAKDIKREELVAKKSLI